MYSSPVNAPVRLSYIIISVCTLSGSTSNLTPYDLMPEVKTKFFTGLVPLGIVNEVEKIGEFALSVTCLVSGSSYRYVNQNLYVFPTTGTIFTTFVYEFADVEEAEAAAAAGSISRSAGMPPPPSISYGLI